MSVRAPRRISTPPGEYLLGHEDAELERLQKQGETLEAATRLILHEAGVGPGMTVLDVGTGTGEVAALVAEMIGPTGSVLGIDSSSRAIAQAKLAWGGGRYDNITFAHADIRDWHDSRRFDAIVGRLVLMYLPGPVRVLKSWRAWLRTGGVIVSMEYDLTAARTTPAARLTDRAIDWIVRTVAATGHDQLFGVKVSGMMKKAGYADVSNFGVQSYIASGDTAAARMLAGIVRSLLPHVVESGIATASEVDIDTLEQRIEYDLVGANAAFLPPTLVGTSGFAKENR